MGDDELWRNRGWLGWVVAGLKGRLGVRCCTRLGFPRRLSLNPHPHPYRSPLPPLFPSLRYSGGQRGPAVG